MKIKCLLKPNFLRVQSFPEYCKSMQLVTRQLEKARESANITGTAPSVVNTGQTGSTSLREAADNLLGVGCSWLAVAGQAVAPGRESTADNLLGVAVAPGRESELVFNAGKALRTFQEEQNGGDNLFIFCRLNPLED
jgi:hypothetical protein